MMVKEKGLRKKGYAVEGFDRYVWGVSGREISHMDTQSASTREARLSVRANAN